MTIDSHQDTTGQRLRFGLFISLNSLAVTEAIAGSGFDYVVFDAEHSPLTLPGLHAMLVALGPDGPEAVVRTASHDVAAIKHYLDLGVRTLMFPNVENAQQAQALVRATRYPPAGGRGVAGTMRASRYGRDKSYLHTAGDGITIWAQIESRNGLDHLEAILRVDGVNGIYFGPNDMSADHGAPGQAAAPENVQRITQAAGRVRSAGKAAGILCGEAEFERYRQAGITTFAFASDASLLVRSADALAAKYAAVRPGDGRG